ncbi:MAG: uracil-DNA glycosylase [Acholeplasmataceae bacterium]
MTWNDILTEEFNKAYFKELLDFLKKEELITTILPKKEDWFKAFKLTPFDKVKVVIIGQDPYHGLNQAHGLAFSTLEEKLPPSLKNIFKELVSDLQVNYPKNGNLTKWANEGVLLLNTILTVSLSEPLSHKNKGWELFFERIISELNKNDRPLVFILWGNNAIYYEKYLTNKKHLIHKSSHPSPLSARVSFFGSKPFSKTNNFLIKNNVKPINWDLS